MLYLNEYLLKDLAHTLRMTYKEISSLSNISITTLYRILEAPSRISVQQLIDLANGLCVPVSRFFSCNNDDKVGQREDYIKLHGYMNCYYDKDAMQRVIDSIQVSSFSNISSLVGLHPNRVKESLLAERRLPVTRLLKFCNSLNLSSSYFIVDPNHIDDSAKQERSDFVSTSQNLSSINMQRDITKSLHDMLDVMIEMKCYMAHIDKKIGMLIDVFSEDLKYSELMKRGATRTKQIAKQYQRCIDGHKEHKDIV